MTARLICVGTVPLIAVQGNRLYAATNRKGIQVVDLDQVISEFQGSPNVTINYDINTAGQGFAKDASDRDHRHSERSHP
jgi:hypothetical protein